MERKHASAGPNRQMYDMYNTNVRTLNGFDSAAYASSEYPGSIKQNAINEMSRTDNIPKKLDEANKTGALS